jgi:hypothetical protein
MRFLYRMRRAGAGIGLALCVVFGATAPAIAATTTTSGFNLTISPLPIGLSTNPGQAVTTPIRVENSGNEAVRLKVSLMKFRADGTSGEPKLEDPTPQDEFIQWATFDKTSFVAQPRVFNTVNLTIKPPKSAAFGYYYAVVFSQDNGNQPAVPSQNRINGAVASLVLLNVQTDGEKRTLEVTDIRATKKVYQYLPASVDITVKNTGNIHVVPAGNIFISRAGSDEFIGTLVINENQGNVLPNSSRTFRAEWNDGFPSYQVKRENGQVVSDQTGTPIRELSWSLGNIEKLRLGQYDASMTLIYNDGQRDVPLSGEVSFWVIPWVPFLVLLVALALIGLGVFVLARSALRRARSLRKPKG